MAEWVLDRWDGGSVSGLPARHRRSGEYHRYLPDLLSARPLHVPAWLESKAAAVERRVRDLGSAPGVEGLEGVAHFLLRSEAIASSRIEGIAPSPQQVALAELAQEEPFGGVADQARLVANNITVLRSAASSLAEAEAEAVTVADVEALQRALLPEERHHGSETSAAASGSGADPGSPGAAALTATLVDPEGAEVGTVEMDSLPEGTSVTVTASGLEPGFHGLHVHGTGLCEPDSQSPTDPAMTGDFLSAGGHLGVDESDHGSHAGDLPSLYVTSGGEATLMFVTDGFTVDDVTDADGSAVMVHSGVDNFANVPERYAPEGPDQDTLDTGDSGTRVACGVVG